LILGIAENGDLRFCRKREPATPTMAICGKADDYRLTVGDWKQQARQLL
jgi:hypothetical protein